MYRYSYDGAGNLKTVKDASGIYNTANDAYGSLLSHDCYSGSVSQPYQYVGQLGYYTHWIEPDFGLLQLGVRFYDPEVGRFTQRDSRPVDRENGFTYCYGRPTRLTDPSGRFPWNLLTCPKACKGINECSWTGDKCRDCAFSLMVDPQYWSANVIMMLGSIRGGISSGTLTDAMAKCWPEAEEFCIKKHSGSMTVMHFAECVAGKVKIDVQTILKVLKAILKGKAEDY
ncbi:MAG: RHS repeat-associated core domain-containing protein [Armatimonadota bacterium]|nr:RHS repeat-associated core domain-containing protein [Armatimonadota bacterium]